MTSSSNGYFKMNNALFEAVYHSELTLMQKEILMLVIRFTDGYHRDIADLSYSFISQGIGRDKRHVIRNVNELIKKRVLFREDDMKINKLGVNKNIKEWDVIFRDSGSAATTSSGAQAMLGSGLQATSGSGAQATEEIITTGEYENLKASSRKREIRGLDQLLNIAEKDHLESKAKIDRLREAFGIIKNKEAIMEKEIGFLGEQ